MYTHILHLLYFIGYMIHKSNIYHSTISLYVYIYTYHNTYTAILWRSIGEFLRCLNDHQNAREFGLFFQPDRGRIYGENESDLNSSKSRAHRFHVPNAALKKHYRIQRPLATNTSDIICHHLTKSNCTVQTSAAFRPRLSGAKPV